MYQRIVYQSVVYQSIDGQGSSDTKDQWAIEANDLVLTLPSDAGMVEVIRGVDLKIPSRETVGIVGPSGSGKTSLMMVLSGLEKLTSGKAVVDGVDITHMDEDGLARFRQLRIGIVFQAFHLIATMNALENVALPLELAHHPQAMARAAEALEMVGLSHRLRHFPWQLSGGEQQRVAVARAFVAHPQILFADEPTGNLDRDSGEKVADLLFGMVRDFGSTLVLITHDAALADRCATRLTMDSGRLASGSRQKSVA